MVFGQQQNYKQNRMLDKYEAFQKLSKSPECSIYTAFNRANAQSVLIKRITTKLSWNQILVHRHIQLMNKSKVFSKMVQILRHKGNFYIVFEKPSGNSLSMTNSTEKIVPSSFYPLFYDLLEGIKEIQAVVPSPAILPEWIYFHRNMLKVIHFEVFLDVQQSQSKHIFTYKMSNQNPQSDHSEDQASLLPEQYKKALVFHLGMIAYRFLVGKKEQEIKSKERYQQIFQDIRQNCERQIIKSTADSRLANFISKMISANLLQTPTFAQVYNFFQARTRESKGKQVHKNLSMEIQLQKIHIGTGKKVVEPIKLRKCCIKQEEMGKFIQNDKISSMKAKSTFELNKIKQSKLFLPYIATNRNFSCLNRHNPFLSTVSKQNNTKRHIKSFDFRQTEMS